jgi:DNA-binding NtrC family response regulator
MTTRPEIKILIVDDEEIVRESMAAWLRGEGYRIATAASAEEALSLLDRQEFDIGLIDLKMPGMDGIELTERIRRTSPDMLCLIITARATLETAVDAMKKGAFDYISKPFYPEEVSLIIEKISAHLKRLEQSKLQSPGFIQTTPALGTLLSVDRDMLRLFELAKESARSSAAVLIVGETGTEKDTLARAMHAQSPRRAFPFVPVSCLGPRDLALRRELFGHEAGAFPDASLSRSGKLEIAHRGTLFLEEISGMSAPFQSSFLKVIRDRQFSRLGGTAPISIDIRVISSTARDIDKMVLSGEFQEELYYRLSVITLKIPPLRERKEDIPLMAGHLLERLARETGMETPPIIHPDALALLLRYPFPGNLQELESAVEHASTLSAGGVILPGDLPPAIRNYSTRND